MNLSSGQVPSFAGQQRSVGLLVGEVVLICCIGFVGFAVGDVLGESVPVGLNEGDFMLEKIHNELYKIEKRHLKIFGAGLTFVGDSVGSCLS